MAVLTYFTLPNRVIFGAGAAERAGKESKQMGITSALVVTDRGLVASGIAEGVKSNLENAGLRVEVFDGVAANPDDRCVDAGLEAFHSADGNGLIGLGGGSAIDTAKAIGLLQSHPKPITQYDGAKGGMQKIKDRMPPLIAIPTTAGTGSEASSFAVITDSERHFKIAIGSPYLMPKLALVDPALTLNLPRHVTVHTGLDALTHLVEGYVSRVENPLMDRLALYGLELIRDHFRRVIENPQNLESRSQMMMAAMTAAFVYDQKFLGANHSLAHALSAMYNIPHGLANALFLPTLMRFNRNSVGEKYNDIGRALGGHDGIAEVERLISDLGVELGLRNHGVKSEDIDLLTAKAFEDPSHGSNPRQPVTKADLAELFRSALPSKDRRPC